MVSVNSAYEIAKQKYQVSKLLSCLDFGSFYLFSFAPLFENTNEGYLTGTTFDAVDKTTGVLYEYDISSDIDAFDRAKEIKVETFLDIKV